MSGPKPIPSADQIKANLKALQDQNAPEDVIDRYMASVGAKPVDEATKGADYGWADALANGMMGGFRSEAKAELRAHGIGKNTEGHGNYSEELAKENAAEQQYAQEHPWGNRGLEFAGTAIPSVLMGGASAAGKAASLGRAFLTNAAVGSVYGAGNAPEGAANRAKGAFFGGAVGGAGGALFQKLAGPIAEAIPGINTIGRKLGLLRKPEEAADAYLAGRMAQDGGVPQVRADVLATPDTKPEILADVAGRNVQGATRRAVNTPGEAADNFAKFTKARGANAPERAGEDLTSVGLSPVNQHATLDQLIAAQKANAAPLYEKALSGTVNDPELNSLIEEFPALQAAKAEAEGMAQSRNLASRLRRQAPSSAVGDGIPAQTLHDMKLAIDDMVKRHGYMAPGGTGSTNNGISKDVAAAFRQRIGEVIPGYNEAAAQFAGDQAVKDAFEAGTRHLADEGSKSAYEIAQMSPSEQQAYKMGAGANLRTSADKIGPKGDVGNKLLGTNFKQKQVQAVLNDPKAYGQFKGLMNRESNMAATANLQGGSQTAPILAENADAAKTMGGLGGFIAHPVRATAGFLADRMQGVTPEVNQAIGSRAMAGANGGRAELLSALDALEKAGLPKQQKARYLASIIAAMSGATVGGGVR